MNISRQNKLNGRAGTLITYDPNELTSLNDEAIEHNSRPRQYRQEVRGHHGKPEAGHLRRELLPLHIRLALHAKEYEAANFFVSIRVLPMEQGH